MLTLTQFSSDLKSQALPNRSIIKEPPSDRSTYRFIQIRSGSFRSKFKESPPAQLKVINNVNYAFRKPSAVSEDEQTSAQFKVAYIAWSSISGRRPSSVWIHQYLRARLSSCALRDRISDVFMSRWCCWEIRGWVKLASWFASKTKPSCLALTSLRSVSITG